MVHASKVSQWNINLREFSYIPNHTHCLINIWMTFTIYTNIQGIAINREVLKEQGIKISLNWPNLLAIMIMGWGDVYLAYWSKLINKWWQSFIITVN